MDDRLPLVQKPARRALLLWRCPIPIPSSHSWTLPVETPGPRLQPGASPGFGRGRRCSPVRALVDPPARSHSVVEVVTDDTPFLVDSVTNELSRQGRGIHLVIHPQVIVRRDVTGKLIEVYDSTCEAHGNTGKGKAAELPHDAVTESWIHVEIDRETDREDLQQITADLLRVLSDVREAVEDWEKMRGAALRIADELPAEPTAGDLRDQEIDEARELLRWLSADHLTFLGFREYELVSAPGEDGAEAEGNVISERRFLGLFSSATYTESVRRADGRDLLRSWRPTRATRYAPFTSPAAGRGQETCARPRLHDVLR